MTSGYAAAPGARNTEGRENNFVATDSTAAAPFPRDREYREVLAAVRADDLARAARDPHLREVRAAADAELAATLAWAREYVPPIPYAYSQGYGAGWGMGYQAGLAEAERAATARTRVWTCVACGRREYRERASRAAAEGVVA